MGFTPLNVVVLVVGVALMGLGVTSWIVRGRRGDKQEARLLILSLLALVLGIGCTALAISGIAIPDADCAAC